MTHRVGMTSSLRSTPVKLPMLFSMAKATHGACRTDLGLPDRSRRLDIDDDRRLQVDQVVVGVGKERMPFVSAGPLRGRIRPGDELRYRLAGCAPGSLIQGIEIFPDGSARPGDGLPVDIIRPGSRALLVGIGSNQAGIDRKGSPVDQPFGDAAPDHSLEQLAQQIAIAEAAMPILGEGRVLWHLAVEPEPTEPAVSEVQVNLLAQPTQSGHLIGRRSTLTAAINEHDA